MPFVFLDQLPKQSVQWLWPGRLTLGHLAILDGDPGLGKSLVTLDLCVRISTGRAFPDGKPIGEPASVIVINAEDGARDVIPGRLIAAGADLSRVQVFDRDPGEPFLRLPGDLHRLEDAIAHSGARYVVLDPIMSFLDSSVNIASDQSVRAALAPLADLAQRYNCAIQMVRHLNKGRGKNALYRGLYSIGFIASCRLSWLIARDPQHAKQYVLAQPKNNLDAPPTSLAYTIEGDETGNARIVWHGLSTLDDSDLMAGTPDRLRKRMSAEEFLLAFLKDGPRNTRDIWEVLRSTASPAARWTAPA
jgi:AAA domain